MGFGHRIYKTLDPRAKILLEHAERIASTDEERNHLAILEALQKAMLREKGLYPNVDFYSGFVLQHLGVPDLPLHTRLRRGTDSWVAGSRDGAVLGQQDNEADRRLHGPKRRELCPRGATSGKDNKLVSGPFLPSDLSRF